MDQRTEEVPHRVIGQVEQNRESLMALVPRGDAAISHHSAVAPARLELDDAGPEPICVFETVRVGVGSKATQILVAGQDVAVRGSGRVELIAAAEAGLEQAPVP